VLWTERSMQSLERRCGCLEYLEASSAEAGIAGGVTRSCRMLGLCISCLSITERLDIVSEVKIHHISPLNSADVVYCKLGRTWFRLDS
jgi:hypothetical protein